MEAHILISFLSLALWRSLEQWMQSKGMGSNARPLIEAVESIHSMDVVVPVKRDAEIVEVRVRTVARPDEDAATLLAHLDLRLPRRSRLIENVVEKIR